MLESDFYGRQIVTSKVGARAYVFIAAFSIYIFFFKQGHLIEGTFNLLD